MAKEREERRKHDQNQRQLKYEARDDRDREWFPRKPLSLRILNPNARARLKQILTVDNTLEFAKSKSRQPREIQRSAELLKPPADQYARQLVKNLTASMGMLQRSTQ